MYEKRMVSGRTLKLLIIGIAVCVSILKAGLGRVDVSPDVQTPLKVPASVIVEN